MDHSAHTRLSPGELTEAILAKAPVYGEGNAKVGTIAHVHGEGAGADVVIDVGGFLGIGAKPVLLSIGEIDLMRDENGRVHGKTAWTKEQLKDLPAHRH